MKKKIRKKNRETEEAWKRKEHKDCVTHMNQLLHIFRLMTILVRERDVAPPQHQFQLIVLKDVDWVNGIPHDQLTQPFDVVIATQVPRKLDRPTACLSAVHTEKESIEEGNSWKSD